MLYSVYASMTSKAIPNIYMDTLSATEKSFNGGSEALEALDTTSEALEAVKGMEDTLGCFQASH